MLCQDIQLTRDVLTGIGMLVGLAMLLGFWAYLAGKA